MTKKEAHHYGFCKAKCIHWKARRCQADNRRMDVPEGDCVIVEEQRRAWQREMMNRG